MSNNQIFKIPPGYYNFTQLAEYLEPLGITLDVNDKNGIVTATSSNNVKISQQLKNVLGLPKKTIKVNETYIGDKPIDLCPIKNIYVHLEQLNTSYNFLNGKRSTVLGVIQVENKKFGDIITVKFDTPIYKYLSGGTIHELELSIRDEDNKKINNHNLPVSCVLEII